MSKNRFISEEMTEEEQENLELVAKKREKKRKTKEEKGRDRRIVFWVMALVMILSAGFWLKAYFEGRITKTQKLPDASAGSSKNSKTQNMEENGKTEKSDFVVKYKI